MNENTTLENELAKEDFQEKMEEFQNNLEWTEKDEKN